MKKIATVTLMLFNAFLLALLFLIVTSCGFTKRHADYTITDVVDCTTSKAKDAIHQFAPTVEQLVVNTLDTAGHADWNTIESATKNFATDVGGCVLQATVTRLLAEAHTAGVMSSPLEIDRADLARSWDQLREQRYSGVTFKGAD